MLHVRVLVVLLIIMSILTAVLNLSESIRFTMGFKIPTITQRYSWSSSTSNIFIGQSQQQQQLRRKHITHQMLPKCHFSMLYSKQFGNNLFHCTYKVHDRQYLRGNGLIGYVTSARQTFMKQTNKKEIENDVTFKLSTMTSSSSSSSSSLWKAMSIQEKEMMNDCTKIIDAAIDAVDPIRAVQKHLTIISDTNTSNNNNSNNNLILQVNDVITAENLNSSNNNNKKENIQFDILNDYDQIFIVSFGKASSAMTYAVVNTFVQQQINNNLHIIPSIMNKISGYVICKDNYCTKEERTFLEQYNITICEASHPIPDERSVTASFDLLNKLHEITTVRNNINNNDNNKKTLVIACISGGGSSLFCTPHPNILNLTDLIQTNTILLQSGLSIIDMNIIRKRLEHGKGGRLAAAAAAGGRGTGSLSSSASSSNIVTLILSDVIGDPLDLIASGPTVPDTSSWLDAWNIVQENEFLITNLPLSVINLLHNGYKGVYDDNDYNKNSSNTNSDRGSSSSSTINSPTIHHPIFQNKRSTYCLVGNNYAAVYSAATMSKNLGYIPIVLGTQWQGEASTVGTVLISIVQQILSSSSTTTNNDPYSILHRITATESSDDSSNNKNKKHKSIAIIVGGETTVTIPSGCTGVGGRNQELVLAAGIQLNKLLKGKKENNINVVIASIGTDGTDGPTDAAGAIINSGTISRLDYAAATAVAASCSTTKRITSNEALQNHDSYNYFNNNIDPIEYGGTGMIALDKRGPTGTNVADVIVVLIHLD